MEIEGMKKTMMREIPRRFENQVEMIKEIQRILLLNDYSINSVFQTTQYMKDNLETNIEWSKKYFARKSTTKPKIGMKK